MDKEKSGRDERKERKRRGEKERERSESRDRSSRTSKRVKSKERGMKKTVESIQKLDISQTSDSDMALDEGIIAAATKCEKAYSCQIDVEYPEKEAEKREILSRIELLIKSIQKSDVDLKFIKEIIQEENEEEYMFLDFLPSVDFKELPWSSVRFTAENLTPGSTVLNFSLTFLEQPRNAEDMSVYRVMELIILTSIEKLQFIKSVKLTETATAGNVFLTARMTSSLSSFTNESVQRMLNELREILRHISGESVSGHVATEAEIDRILKSLLEQKGDQIELLNHLTPFSMRKIVKDSLITKKDTAQVSIEIVGESLKAKTRNIPSSSYWLFPFNFRKLSDLPSNTLNEISTNLTRQLPTGDQIWYKGFLSRLVGPTFSNSEMIEVMRKIVSTAWPYPEILESYSNHGGTLGGLIEALDKFGACVEKQEEKETISNYKCEIEKIRQSMYDEIILNLNCPSQLSHVKTMEEFEEMHRKLKLNIETNEMKKFGGIKNDLKEGDQLWIFHKRWLMRSYAHVVIISDGGKYIHVSSPQVKLMIMSRAIICEEQLGAINDDDLCFVVKPSAGKDPTVCKNRAKACLGIRFDYDGETETCETFCNGVHGQWSENIQNPQGVTQNLIDEFTKASYWYKTKDDPLRVQMRRKIQDEKLIFPYERF